MSSLFVLLRQGLSRGFGGVSDVGCVRVWLGWGIKAPAVWPLGRMPAGGCLLATTASMADHMPLPCAVHGCVSTRWLG